jgi:hypothetical protein
MKRSFRIRRGEILGWKAGVSLVLEWMDTCGGYEYRGEARMAIY